MLQEILRFYREAPRLIADSDPDLTLAEFLDREGYGREFVDYHLYPVTAAIWSSPHAGMRDYPAAALIRFFQNHGLLSLTKRPRWRTITGGSRHYVEKLTAPFADAIRRGSPVTHVERNTNGVTIHSPDSPAERFDQVVLACHADQALSILDKPTRHEDEVLSAFPYAANDTALHSDTHLMPRRRAAWASWNYHRLPQRSDRVVVTYYQNRLQRLRATRPYLVTLNYSKAVATDLVHARMTYHHPQYDARAVKLQPEIGDLNGQNRTYYCGAYWGYGFHEDGVVSGLRVAQAFGEEL
jgi:predicted NAD/FAD-binding protein